MERKIIYILREDMYHEWSWENGATNLIYVSHNMYEVVDRLKQYMKMELMEDSERVLENVYGKHDIDEIVKDTIDIFCKNGQFASVDVYINEDDYQSGKNSGTFVIEKMEVE